MPIGSFAGPWDTVQVLGVVAEAGSIGSIPDGGHIRRILAIFVVQVLAVFVVLEGASCSALAMKQWKPWVLAQLVDRCWSARTVAAIYFSSYPAQRSWR